MNKFSSAVNFSSEKNFLVITHAGKSEKPQPLQLLFEALNTPDDVQLNTEQEITPEDSGRETVYIRKATGQSGGTPSVGRKRT